jgi:hypothetical protein
VSLSSLPLIERALAACVRSPSEYSVSNIFLYRHRHDYRLVNGRVPMIVGRTYDGVSHILPLGPLDDAAIDDALSLADCVYPLDEIEALRIGERKSLAASYNDADSDYIYDAARLSRLEGAKLKRSQAASFDREASPQLLDMDSVGEAAAYRLLEGWFDDVGRPVEATDLAECREAIALRHSLGLEGWIAVSEGQAAGFVLAGSNRAGTRTIHFAKGRRACAGVYPWMFARFAESCGAQTLNFEQDLGNPGFAQAKRALGATARIRKYRVGHI